MLGDFWAVLKLITFYVKSMKFDYWVTFFKFWLLFIPTSDHTARPIQI